MTSHDKPVHLGIDIHHPLNGRTRALTLGYDVILLDKYAGIAQAYFSGAGNPFLIGSLHSGDVVVDIGCGSGTDSCIAAGMVKSTGRVFGIEMNAHRLKIAREQASKSRLTNITFMSAYAERLPLPDSCADVVISNGMLSQCTDKRPVLMEIHRILKPGGRIQLADLIQTAPQPNNESISKHLTSNSYQNLLRAEGFTGVRFAMYQLDPGARQLAFPERIRSLTTAHILAHKPVQ